MHDYYTNKIANLRSNQKDTAAHKKKLARNTIKHQIAKKVFDQSNTAVVKEMKVSAYDYDSPSCSFPYTLFFSCGL